jgi:hypothetical protein
MVSGQHAQTRYRLRYHRRVPAPYFSDERPCPTVPHGAAGSLVVPVFLSGADTPASQIQRSMTTSMRPEINRRVSWCDPG